MLWEQLNKFAEIVLPILIGISVAGIQRLYLQYRTKKFKLIDHSLFVNLALSINDIDNWRPEKNRMVFIDALKIKLSCWLNQGKLLAEELQKCHCSNTQLKNKILLWTTETINKYTDLWKKEGIPDKIIERITNNHQSKVNQFVDEITSICYNNDMYPFKMQKVIAIFNILRILLAETKNDFNKLVYREKYNGDFLGIKYKGIPINDDEYDIYIVKQQNKFD